MTSKEKEREEINDEQIQQIPERKKAGIGSKLWGWIKRKLAIPAAKKTIKYIIVTIVAIEIANYSGCISLKWQFFQREKTSYTSDAIREELVKIGELATLQYNYTIVSDLVYTNKTAWIFSNEDRLIYSIDGVIKLGIDCNNLEIDCDNDNRILTVYLPPVKILSHELDESSYHEYLMKGNISTSEFNETRIDDKIEQEKKIEENGIKEQALENAKDTLGNILKAAIVNMSENDQQPYEILFKSTEEIQ